MNLPKTIIDLRDTGALFVLNDSGGKDSQAMRLALRDDVPASQKLVIHATLGEAEWPGALEHAREGAEREGLPFVVARAVKTFFEMVEHRYAVRPGPNSSCWPSASNRQCTSDLKRGPIEREIRRELKERGLNHVVTCMGIRAEESFKRAKLSTFKINVGNCIPSYPTTRKVDHERYWYEWLPIFRMTRDEVFASIASAGEKPHYAYAAGNERLSCMFCIMGSKNDLRNAALANPDLYRRYVEIERRTGYTMHQSRKSLEVLTGVSTGGAA